MGNTWVASEKLSYSVAFEYREYTPDNSKDGNKKTVYGIGCDGFGKFGDPQFIDGSQLHKLEWSEYITNIKCVGCGNRFNSFLNDEGMVWSSGCNSSGNLGANQWKGLLRKYDVPLPIKSLQNKYVEEIIVGVLSEQLWLLVRNNNDTKTIHMEKYKNVVTHWIRYYKVNDKCNNMELISMIVTHIGYIYDVYGCGDQLSNFGVSGYPIPVKYFNNNINVSIVDIACGANMSIFLDLNGNIWTLGSNRKAPPDNGYEQKMYDCPKRIEFPIDINIKHVVINQDKVYCVCMDDVIAMFDTYFPENCDRDYVIPINLRLIDYFKNKGIKIQSIGAGKYYVMILDENGCVYYWGSLVECNMNIDVYEDLKRPKVIEYFVENNVGIKSIHCGLNHVLFKGMNGNIYSMGNNFGNACCVQWTTYKYLTDPMLIDVADQPFDHNDVIDIFCGAYTTFLVVKS